MSELDNKIREALQREDADLLQEFDEPSMFEMVMETFRGRHRWMSLLGVFWGVVFMVLCVVCAVKFFNAQEVRQQLLWAAACVLCMSAISMMKVWYWMELNKNAITREIKRLELQIARLSGRMRHDS